MKAERGGRWNIEISDRNEASAYLVGFRKLLNYIDHKIQHRLGKSGIGSEAEGLVHDRIGSGKRRGGCAVDGGFEFKLTLGGRERAVVAGHDTNGLGAILAQSHEDGLTKQIASKEHPVADLVLVVMATEIGGS